MGNMHETLGLDPAGTGSRVWGRGDTKEESLRQSRLALTEYLSGTRRWNYWNEWVDNGFKFVTSEVDDTFMQSDPL